MTNSVIDTHTLDLTIVVAASKDHRSVEPTLAAIDKQLDGKAVEVLVATDRAEHARVVRDRFPRVGVIQADEPRLVPDLWGMGAAQARGRWIALTMASVIPNDDWVETLLCARDQDQAAVGGAIENRRDAKLVDWAVYFVRYTAFMLPFRAGPVSQVAADNAAYRQAAIANQMEWIATNGFWEAEVNNRLRAQGKSLFGDPALVVRYANGFTFGGFMRQRFMHGKIFGQMRAAKSKPSQRMLYILTSPAIPLTYLVRIVRNVVGKRRNRLAFVLALPITGMFLVCWGVGEFVGLVMPHSTPPTPSPLS